MNKLLFLSVFLLFAGHTVSWSQESKDLKKVIQLKIPREGGANGAQVAWNPAEKKYYAAMAGNSSFCLGVYNTEGILVSSTSQQTMFDIRGFWYNPATRSLQMNGYNDFGIAEYTLDSDGIPADVKILKDGMNQPTEQSSAAYNPTEKVMYFFSEDGGIEVYTLSTGGYERMIDIALGLTKEADKEKVFSRDNLEVLDDYNTTTVVYTGISGAEIGLLNHYKKQVEFYSLKSGYMTRKWLLPTDAPAQTILNFSYCNGIFWLFDKQLRIWNGYK